MAGHSERQWQGKFFKCGMRCWYCYEPLMLQEATKDHLTPRSRGGSDTIANIVPACLQCNQRKGVMTEQEFRTAFSTALKMLKGVPFPAEKTNFSMIDQPSLDELRKESEGISWAWKTPAVYRRTA